jgi:hypothetical protein
LLWRFDSVYSGYITQGGAGGALAGWWWHHSRRRRDCSRVLTACVQAPSLKGAQRVPWWVAVSLRARCFFFPTHRKEHFLHSDAPPPKRKKPNSEAGLLKKYFTVGPISGTGTGRGCWCSSRSWVESGRCGRRDFFLVCCAQACSRLSLGRCKASKPPCLRHQETQPSITNTGTCKVLVIDV